MAKPTPHCGKTPAYSIRDPWAAPQEVAIRLSHSKCLIASDTAAAAIADNDGSNAGESQREETRKRDEVAGRGLNKSSSNGQ